MRYLLVINPRAQLGISKRKQRKIIKTAEKILGRGEILVVDQKYKLDPENFEVIIFCGGDGTFHRGIQDIFSSQKRKSPKKIGLIPLGSGIDMASALKIPKNMEQAFEVIKQGRTRWIDLGKVNNSLFVNTFSIGFDAFINQLQERKIRPLCSSLKKMFGFLLPIDAKWCYLSALFLYLFSTMKFEAEEIEIETEKRKFRKKIHLLAVTNSFRYGGGFKINPQAKVDDGLLDACLISPLTKPAILKKIVSVRRGTHIYDKRVEVFQFQKLKITSKRPLIIQADGEMLKKEMVFEIEVIHPGIKVFVP